MLKKRKNCKRKSTLLDNSSHILSTATNIPMLTEGCLIPSASFSQVQWVSHYSFVDQTPLCLRLLFCLCSPVKTLLTLLNCDGEFRCSGEKSIMIRYFIKCEAIESMKARQLIEKHKSPRYGWDVATFV